MRNQLVIVQVVVILIVSVLSDDDRKVEMVEEFITYYHRKPEPERVPAVLDRLVKSRILQNQTDDGSGKQLLVAHAFGHIARGQPKLVRLYESRFAQGTAASRAFLLEALRICGDDVTRSQLEMWSRDLVYRDQQKQLEAAITFLADPKRRLPRDRPALNPMDLDLLWADFLITGEYAPVARILDTLDQPGNLRETISQCLKTQPGNQEIVETLTKLKLVEPGSKNKLVEGDLDLILFHDAKGRLRPHAVEAAKYLGKEILKLTDDELNRGLLLKGTATWSLQENLEQHPELSELLKKHCLERPAKSQDLVKKWLRIDQPKIVLGKESERLQGAWQATAWEEDGNSDNPRLQAETLKFVRWIFEGDELTMTKAFSVTTGEETKVTGQGTPWISSYKIDGAKSPKVIILTSVSPEEGNIIKCIYAVEGDVLRVCMSKKGRVPDDFSAKQGSDCILVTLKRVRKR